MKKKKESINQRVIICSVNVPFPLRFGKLFLAKALSIEILLEWIMRLNDRVKEFRSGVLKGFPCCSCTLCGMEETQNLSAQNPKYLSSNNKSDGGSKKINNKSDELH